MELVKKLYKKIVKQPKIKDALAKLQIIIQSPSFGKVDIRCLEECVNATKKKQFSIKELAQHLIIKADNFWRWQQKLRLLIILFYFHRQLNLEQIILQNSITNVLREKKVAKQPFSKSVNLKVIKPFFTYFQRIASCSDFYIKIRSEQYVKSSIFLFNLFKVINLIQILLITKSLFNELFSKYNGIFILQQIFEVVLNEITMLYNYYARSVSQMCQKYQGEDDQVVKELLQLAKYNNKLFQSILEIFEIVKANQLNIKVHCPQKLKVNQLTISKLERQISLNLNKRNKSVDYGQKRGQNKNNRSMLKIKVQNTLFLQDATNYNIEQIEFDNFQPKQRTPKGKRKSFFQD